MNFRKNILGGIVLSLIWTVGNAQIVNIEDARVRMADSVHWLGFADLGGNIQKNATYVYSARGAFQVEYKNKKHFLLSVSQYNLLKNGNTSILNDGMQHVRYNRDLGSKLVFEAFGQVQYNERISLTQRILGGGGLRLKIWKIKFGRGYAGVAYMREQTRWRNENAPRNDDRITSYISMNHHVKDKFRVSATFYFQPFLTNWNNNRIAGVMTGQVFFTKKLSFRTNFSVNYDNDPRLASSIPDLTFVWSNGLRLDF